MKMILYGLKNCGTCRKAIKALEATGRDISFVDVRADGVSKTQLKKWEKALGWEALLNTRSTTWRELGPSDKENMSATKAINLIAVHPTLMKRPLIEIEGDTLIGWTAKTQAALL